MIQKVILLLLAVNFNAAAVTLAKTPSGTGPVNLELGAFTGSNFNIDHHMGPISELGQVDPCAG